jgi:hypothetical protein
MICYLLESPQTQPFYVALLERTLGRGMPYWTASPQKAIRFVRKQDAELFQVLVSSYLPAMICHVVTHEFDDPAV